MEYQFGPTRKSIRVKNFDYTTEGMYYITLVTAGRKQIFGHIQNAIMDLSPAGEMVQRAWIDLPRYDSRITLNDFIVMPNHLHGIIVIGTSGRPRGAAPTMSIPDLMDRFKSWTTRQYFDGVKDKRWPAVCGRLWQRNYYEHIIRSDEDLARIREYIRVNPKNWANDPENPF